MQKTKIFVIGDPHFKINNVSETDAMAESCISNIIKCDPDFIVVLGDVLDRHESIHVSPQTRAVKFLEDLSNIKPVYLLIGNHDLKNNRQFLSEEHPFTALKLWGERMTVVDKTVIRKINGMIFTFVPYVPPGRFIEALDTCEGWKESKCIFCHQEFKGAKLGATFSIEGDEWPNEYPYVVSGHIHNYQELQNNILYTGTPIQHTYGDFEDKTVSCITFFDSERVHERIKLDVRKKKILRITTDEIAHCILPENYDLKIVISGTSGQLAAAMKHQKVKIWKNCGHKIVPKTLNSLDPSLTIEKGFIQRKKQSFSRELYNDINNNESLKKLYHKLFGKPSDEFVNNYQGNHSTVNNFSTAPSNLASNNASVKLLINQPATQKVKLILV